MDHDREVEMVAAGEPGLSGLSDGLARLHAWLSFTANVLRGHTWKNTIP